MIVRRDSSHPRTDSVCDDLMYARDLLGDRKRARDGKIVTLGGLSTFVPLPLEGERIQVIWLEESSEDPEEPLDSPPVVRLGEAHLYGKAWSRPRLLAQYSGWTQESLAATSLPLDGRQAVLAIWQDRSERLVYTIGLPPDDWSAPRSIDLTIGDRNWLAHSDGHTVLATQIESELYWCRLGVKPVSHRPVVSPNPRIDP